MTVAITVVIAPGSGPALDLRGHLDPDALAAALAALPPCTPTLRRHTPTHHTLHLPSQHSPAGTLADLLTAPASLRLPEQTSPHWAACPQEEPLAGPHPDAVTAAGLPASARQREVLLDALTARPGAALHVEQLHWRWYGPLDTRRFRTAWQSVFAQEPVLRAAFAEGGPAGPRIAVHPHASPHVIRHPYGSADWHSLLVSERLRAFDLHRPGLLRIAVLDEQAGPAGPTRIILTYHHALLDDWSVRLLLRAFYRAYLAGGRTRGGERRPDVRDHLRWLEGQDHTAPRAYWSGAAPPAGSRTLPAAAAPGTLPAGGRARCGHGRTRHRLTPHEARRLRTWAAGLGAAESTALHAAWALLLYRAHGAGPLPAPVAFGVTLSGRGIALEGAATLPAPLRNPLPLYVDVDPALPVARLLADLGERMLGAAAYEWVSQGLIHAWSGREDRDELTETLLSFEPPGPPARPEPRDTLEDELAEEGVQVGPAQTAGAHTPLPLSIGAHHDSEGGLVLTAVNDRSRIADQEADATLAQAALLLRAFPSAVDDTTTVGEFLGVLAEVPVTGPVAPARTPPGGGLITLRPAGSEGAGTILLVPPSDAPDGCYDALADAYRGPEALTTVAAPVDAAACLTALRPALAAGEPLLVGCFSGGGQLAYEVARRIGEHGWQPPLVAIAGTADAGRASVRDLARTLRSAARPPA
ncbi:condensation domain-containing protein [Streptomyces sp. H34-S4]|uniref:condensation domain-containing protein n=1 Tax=Streptomyces sp. H34-S4 TaxID=2996463 RepID=UPI00226ECB91|nr:condensation domain-containing protein [Streptomyces sp. H34-S4]MCY0935107.1 condensation domain-containing protein [Streptomyces sp. H34-S4]